MADDLYAGFTVGSKPLSSLRVIDLKSELDKRSLSKSGSKKDLQERLKRQLQLERLQESAEHNADRVPNLSLQDDAIGTQNEVVKQYLAAQQKTYEIQKEARRQIELSADEVGGSETDASSSQDEGHSPLKLSVRKLRAAHQTVKELKESEVVSSEVEEAEDLSDKSHKRSRKSLGNDNDEKTVDLERPKEREVILEEAKEILSKKEIDIVQEQAENLTTTKKTSPPSSPRADNEEIDKAGLEMKENEEVAPKIDEAEIAPVNDQANRLQNITDSEMAVAIESISALAPPPPHHHHYAPSEESVSQESVIKASQKSVVKVSEEPVLIMEEPVVRISEEPVLEPVVPHREEPVLEPVVPVREEPLIEVNEKPLIEVSEEPIVKVSQEPIVDVIDKEGPKESQENKEETSLEETNTIETPLEKMDTGEIDQPKVPLSGEKAEISEIELSKAVDMVKKSKSKTQVKSEREIDEIKKENTPPPSIRLEEEVRTKDTPSKKKVKAENELSLEQPAEDLSSQGNQTPKVEVKSDEGVKDNEEVPAKMENVNGAKDKPEEVAKVEGRVTRRRKRSSETEEEESPGGSEKRSPSGSRSSASRSSSAASYRSGSGSFSSPSQRRRKKRIRNTDSEASSSDDDRIKAERGKSGSSLSSKQIKTENSPPRAVEVASGAVASVGKRRKWTNASSTESNEIPSLERRKINRGSTVASETLAKEEKEAAVEILKEDDPKKEEPESEKEKEAEKLRESEEAADKKDTLVLDLHATDETMEVSDNEKDLVVETKTTQSTSEKKNVENAKTESAKDSTTSAETSVERVKKITNRKISLAGSTSKEEESGSSKPARKRKWGSISKVVPVSSPVISTESLKGLIPDLAPALTSASIGDDIVSNKSYSLVESASLRRNNQDNNLSLAANVSDKTETSKGGTEEAGGPREVSPARKPVSNILYVRNLVRPFTLNQLKDILGQTGTLLEDGFWIDKIKSKCYVTYETEEQAIETRLALHNKRWPASNPKTLFVDFSNSEELEFQKGGAKPVPPPPTNAPKVETPKEHHPRDSNRKISESSGGAERTRRTSLNEDKKRGGDRGARRIGESNASQHPPTHPIREWDRDKIVQEERRYRGGDRGGRGGGEQRNNRENEKPGGGGGGSKERNAKDRRDKKVSGGASAETKKKVEETPGKLLDDLFRKTKAAPCIYWLPLTEQQIIVRDEQRKQRMLEREKRRQRIEQEERDRLENERKMRLKERDNRINRDRNPGRRSRSASRSPIRMRR